MKQWRMVSIVISLIIVLLIANFRSVYLGSSQIILQFKGFQCSFFHCSIQVKKRSRRNENVNEPSAASVIDLNGTAGQKTSKNANKSSVGEWI